MGQSVEPSARVLDDVLEEITRKLEAGESVDLEAYCTQHPELAERLRQVVPAIRMLEDAAGLTGSSPAAEGEEELTGVLGDFQIIREIGRGGMGIVYEAEQISLSRRVALKVLPFAAVLDSRQLQRFRNEAQAAASLHHSHIVPVYAVGCERGVHYYAMQLIEGATLAEVLAELKSFAAADQATVIVAGDKPAPLGGRAGQVDGPPSDWEPNPAAPPALKKSTLHAARLTTKGSVRGREYVEAVIRLGIQAAEALDYAHQQGIIHRDIKPANLMLDTNGQLWITDFGLARRGPDSDLTMTGDLLGTLRYMSPEQATARRGIVDQRTDIYSLGVTLYELLLLRPVYSQGDRADLLTAILHQEPPRLPRLPGIASPDLETVLRKCLEKDPLDRFSTAAELARDLQNVLGNRPVAARRPPLRERIVRWARQRAAFVLSAAVVLSISSIILAVCMALVLDANRKAKDSQAGRDAKVKQALTALREISTVMDMARTAEDKNGTEYWLEVRRSLMTAYTSFAEEQASDPALRFEYAVSLIRKAFLQNFDGPPEAYEARLARGRELASKAIAILEPLRTENPTNHEYLNELLQAYYIASFAEHSPGNDPVIRLRINSWYSLARNVMREPMDPKVDYVFVLYAHQSYIPHQPEYEAVELLKEQRVWSQKCQEMLQRLTPRQQAEPWNSRLKAVVGATQLNVANALFDRYQRGGHWSSAEREIRFILGHDRVPSTSIGSSPLWERSRLAKLLAKAGRPAESLAEYRAIHQEVLQNIRDLPADPLTDIIADPDAPEESLAGKAFGRSMECLKFSDELKEAGLLDEAEDLHALYYKISRHAFEIRSPSEKHRDRFRQAMESYSSFLQGRNKLKEALLALEPMSKLIASLSPEGRKRIEDSFCRRYARLLYAARDPRAPEWVAKAYSLLKAEAAQMSPRDLSTSGKMDAFCEISRMHAFLLPPDQAQGVLQEALRLAEACLKVFPYGHMEVLNVVYAHRGAAQYWQSHGDLRQARDHWQRAYDFYLTAHQVKEPQPGVRRTPEPPTTPPQRSPDWNSCFHGKSSQRQRALLAELGNNAAWLHVTSPDRSEWNPARARGILRLCVRYFPEVAAYWNSLGVAEYRAGEYQAALDSFHKSMDLSRGGSSADWFFVAMIHWQKGDANEARRWYARAAAWREEHAKNDEELRRFQAEAALLLEIEDVVGQ